MLDYMGMGKFKIIGIGGPKGTGKTTLAENVEKESGGAIVRTPIDDWQYDIIWNKCTPEEKKSFTGDYPREGETFDEWFGRTYTETTQEAEKRWVELSKDSLLEEFYKYSQWAKQHYDGIVYDSIISDVFHRMGIVDLLYGMKTKDQANRKSAVLARDPNGWDGSFGVNFLEECDMAYQEHHNYLYENCFRVLETVYNDDGESQRRNTKIVLDDFEATMS